MSDSDYYVNVFPDNAGKWRMRIMSRNGLKIATSEAYFSKWNATRAARRLNLPILREGQWLQ